mgnify:CR=1 FL=1|tara:strand:- start:66 stop:296 length:231 start_codon:yes stop_codon:yes gene_type:complete
MTFEEKKSLRDELKGTASHERRKKILSRLNYPRMELSQAMDLAKSHGIQTQFAWSCPNWIELTPLTQTQKPVKLTL